MCVCVYVDVVAVVVGVVVGVVVVENNFFHPYS